MSNRPLPTTCMESRASTHIQTVGCVAMARKSFSVTWAIRLRCKGSGCSQCKKKTSTDTTPLPFVEGQSGLGEEGSLSHTFNGTLQLPFQTGHSPPLVWNLVQAHTSRLWGAWPWPDKIIFLSPGRSGSAARKSSCSKCKKKQAQTQLQKLQRCQPGLSAVIFFKSPCVARPNPSI